MIQFGKNEARCSPVCYTKISLGWVEGVTLHPESMKLFEENIGNALQDTDIGKNFLENLPKAPGNQSQNKQIVLHQSKYSKGINQ